jgi:hypothetical protein
MWPPPKLATITFGSSPADIVAGGAKRVPKGVDALKFLFEITEETEPIQSLAEHPFKFNCPWHSRTPVSVMTANVRSARLLAIAAPVAAYWAQAGKHEFGSKNMMQALQTAIKLYKLCAHQDATIPHDLLPLACTQTIQTIGRMTLLVCLCRHEGNTEPQSQTVIATAAHVWGICGTLTFADRQWERYKNSLVQKCKSLIAAHYTHHVINSRWTPAHVLSGETSSHQPYETVYDALSCNPEGEALMTLSTQWDVYKRMGTPKHTPVASALAKDDAPTCVGTPLSMPEAAVSTDWLQSV